MGAWKATWDALMGSYFAKRALIGAGIGAGYGLLSDYTSVGEGALKGGAIGAAIGFVGMGGIAGEGVAGLREAWSTNKLFRERLAARGVKPAKAMWRSVMAQGSLSARYIGRDLTKTYNRIKGLWV